MTTTTMPSGEELAQLSDLVELAGSPRAVLDIVAELQLILGREPLLSEVVNLIMEHKRQGELAMACAGD